MFILESYIDWNQYAPLNKCVFNFDLKSVNDELRRKLTENCSKKDGPAIAKLWWP